MEKSRSSTKVSTFLLPGAFSGGAFKIYLEQSGWTAADLQTEIQAIGGTMASASVTDLAHYNKLGGIRMNNMDSDGDGKVSKWEYFPIGLID